METVETLNEHERENKQKDREKRYVTHRLLLQTPLDFRKTEFPPNFGFVSREEGKKKVASNVDVHVVAPCRVIGGQQFDTFRQKEGKIGDRRKREKSSLDLELFLREGKVVELFVYLGPVMNKIGPILGDIGFVVVFRDLFHDCDDFDPYDAVIPRRTFVDDVAPIRRLG